MKLKQKIKSLLIVFFFFQLAYSQTLITGNVTDESNVALEGISVIITNANTNDILSYTYTNELGYYSLEMETEEAFILSCSAMAYESKTINFDIVNSNKSITKNIILKSKPEALNEIVIEAERPITIKKDTIIFDAKAFKKGNEDVVEDLLRNIPGLDVDSEGTIKIKGKEVEKVMIEGDDFFEKGYKVLTKNMPVNPIDNIQVLENYSNNKLLKGIESSNKVALNLTLKEDAKRQWFGNSSLGSGLPINRYAINGNLMNFGKTNKFYFLTDLNTIGKDATGDIYQLIKPFNLDETANLGYNQKTNTALSIAPFFPVNFASERTTFNNAELVSLNGIFNINKRLKLKALAFFNWDEVNFFRNSNSLFTSNFTDFSITEDYKSRTKSKTSFGKLDFTYNISKTELLELTTKYNLKTDNNESKLLFNNLPTNENLNSENTFIDGKVNYTNKFKDNKVLLITGRFINEASPQNYTFNNFLFADLFPNTIANNIAQLSENKMQFLGTEAHLLNRKDNGNLSEFKLGYTFRKDKLFSSFLLKNNAANLSTPLDYQNDIDYSTSDFYLKSKYLFKLNKLSFIGEIELHQLLNKIENNTVSNTQTPFLISPSVSIKYKINKKNKISTSYSYNIKNAEVFDVYNNYILTSYRTFKQGTGNFNQLNSSSVTFNYQLGNWSDKFFANFFIIYNKNHDFFTTNETIEQNYSQVEKIKIKDRELLNTSLNIDRYFKAIASNLKFKAGLSRSNYKNIINNSDLREINFQSLYYGLELRSVFKKGFNYHLGTKWTTNKVKSTISNDFTDTISFLDLLYDINDNLNLQVQTERYVFGNIDEQNNTYYFLDLESRYTIKKNKLSLSLTGKNLFNVSTYRNTSISDISSTTSEYRILPRYLLLTLDFRF